MSSAASFTALILFILAVWFVFLRPVRRRQSTGVIAEKTFKPAGVYNQFPTGDRTSFRTPTRIPIAECYIFTINAEGEKLPAVFSLNTTAAERFSIGDNVEIEYEVRGIPWVWNVACVLDMKILKSDRSQLS